MGAAGVWVGDVAVGSAAGGVAQALGKSKITATRTILDNCLLMIEPPCFD
jgi:hypothetical protein